VAGCARHASRPLEPVLRGGPGDGKFLRVALTRPANPVRVAIVVGIVLVAVNVIILAGRAQMNGPANVQRNPEIVMLQPNESDQLLPQGEVGAQLRAGLIGQITIDGRAIPQDQVDTDASLGTVLFDPGPGKDIEAFTKGGHVAVLEWWPSTITTAEDARAQGQLRSYTWSFNVG
jgi:hypothetical protein